MAKKSVVARQERRKKLVDKFAKMRLEFKNIVKNKALSMEVREDAMRKLHEMPKDAHPNRLRNRCAMTGRPRGVFSRFGICRHMIRRLASEGQITGLLKSSW